MQICPIINKIKVVIKMETHNKIFNTFNKLIQIKAFDDISVLEICKEAHV